MIDTNKELPKSWNKKSLKDLLEFVIGGDWGEDPEKNSSIDYSTVYCIRGSEIKNWEREKGSTAVIRKIKKGSLDKRSLKIGDVLLEISGGGPDQPVGRTVIIDNDVFEKLNYPIVCTNFLRLLRFKQEINGFYANYFFKNFYLSGEIVKYQGGSNNLRNLKYKEFETIKIPFPNLTEQHRIVAKLDQLFAHLETAKKGLEKIPTLLKEFRQAVLTQAVTGKLTEEWREGKELESGSELLKRIKNKRIEIYNQESEKLLKSGKRKSKSPILEVKIDNIINFNIPDNWKFCSIGEIADVCNGSTPSRPIKEYWNGDIPWVSSGLVQNNRISETKEFLTDFGVDNSSVKILPEGTVLMAMIGEGKTRGQSAILDIKATINQNIAALVINHKLVKSEYLQFWLFVNYENNRIMGNGTGPQALNCQKVRELPFNLPPVEEQTEIVRRVEALFAKADAIEERYKSLKEKIDQLPQAILGKAFRGEL